MAVVLGVTVAPEGDAGPCKGRVFVANHITRLDHLAVHVVTSALKVQFFKKKSSNPILEYVKLEN